MEKIQFTSEMLGGNNNLRLTQYAMNALSQTDHILGLDVPDEAKARKTVDTIEALLSTADRISMTTVDSDLRVSAIFTIGYCRDLLTKTKLTNSSAYATAKIRFKKIHKAFLNQVWATIGKYAYPELSGVKTT